ncbi:MAG: hypothetical protein V3R32_03495 [Nitrosomonadaceae bacterium]
MNRKLKFSLLLIIVLACSACASKITSITSQPTSHKIQKLAVTIHGGVMAEALTRALNKQGFNAVKLADFYRLLERINMKEVNPSDPSSLVKLYEADGIDAFVLSRTTSVDELTGYPNTVIVTVYSTRDGRKLVDLEWENIRTLQRSNSLAENSPKEDIDVAAEKIVKELVKHLR